jgi:peptidoglycan/LPS O-acetylase OafA/YrhL
MFALRSQHNNIDFLRALAVLSVFAHHAQHVFASSIPFFGEYGGQFGPQLFFLISGYLITASCRTYNLKQYVTHRFFRIFPAYWFYFIGIGVLTNVLTSARVLSNPSGLLSNLGLLQQLFPTDLIDYDVLHVTWTLTVEVLWYATLPILLFFFKGISTLMLVVVILLSNGLSFIANLGGLDFVYQAVISQNVAFRYLFVSNHFLVQLQFFILGAYVFERQAYFSKFNAVGMVTLGLFIFLLKPFYFVFNPMLVTGLGLMCFLIAGVASRSIANTVIVFLSEISYSFYLCHFPIILYLNSKYALMGYWGMMLALAATIVVSTISYLLIEKPGMRLGKRIGDRFRTTSIGGVIANPL